MKYKFQTDQRTEGRNTPFFLLNYSEVHYGFGHIEGYVSYVEQNSNGQKSITTFPDYENFEGYTEECLLAGLKIHSQRNLEGDLSVVSEINQPYAISLVYDSVDWRELPKIEKKLAFLKRYQKGMDKMRNDFGYASTFAQWLVFTSKVLNIPMAVKNVNYPNEVRILRPDEMDSHITHMLTSKYRK